MRQAYACRRRLCVLLRFRSKIPLRAENFAAFRASTLDDITAVCRLHALTETVNLAPLTLLGLEGTYHPNTPRFISRIPQATPAKGLVCGHSPETIIAHTGICPHDMNLKYYSGRCKPVSRKYSYPSPPFSPLRAKSQHFWPFPATALSAAWQRRASPRRFAARWSPRCRASRQCASCRSR